jgi:hypothetical protein
MKILTTLTATMLLSSLAMAQGDPAKTEAPAPTAKATFEALDRNSDQRLSKTEAAADDTVSSQFAALDANADGYVNRGEYARATAPTVPRPTEPPLPGPDPE